MKEIEEIVESFKTDVDAYGKPKKLMTKVRSLITAVLLYGKEDVWIDMKTTKPPINEEVELLVEFDIYDEKTRKKTGEIRQQRVILYRKKNDRYELRGVGEMKTEGRIRLLYWKPLTPGPNEKS